MKDELSGSLLGASPEKVRRWAESYLRARRISGVSVSEFLELALRQDGTNRGVTKTKLRKAAALLPQGQPSRSSRKAS